MTYPQDLPERVSKHVDNLIASYHTRQLSDLLVGCMSIFLRFLLTQGVLWDKYTWSVLESFYSEFANVYTKQ